jgi:hypothetical protein
MKQRAWCATALAILTFAARGETEPESAPATSTAPSGEAASPGAAEVASTSHWWSFDETALLNGLGVDSSDGLSGLGIWRTILDLRATGNAQTTKAADYPDDKFYSYLTEQGLTVSNDGWYALDPRLLLGSASVRFGLQQARQDAGDQGTAQNGDITDYYLNMRLLPEKPYNAMLQAAHAEFVTSHAGGGTTASSHTSRGASFFLRESSILREKEIAPYFSATLFAGQEDLNETTTNVGQQFRRDEQRDRIEFDAHNGFETGDLTVNLEQADLDNKIVPQGSFRSRSADVAYSLDFGRDLTKHADTHVNYNERTGNFDTETLDLEGHLIVEHTAFLSSNTYYVFQDVNSLDGSSTAHRANAGVQYMPFLNVSTNLDLFASRVEYDTGTIEGKGTYGGITYNHWLPAGGVLTTSVNAGLQYLDSQLVSSGVPVVDAPYQAPPDLGAGAGFFLTDTDVVTSTIVVVNVRGNGRVPTVLGVDYEVLVEGNRTQIVPLATSAVIQGGDPLEVSYTHLVDPSLRSRTGTQSYYLAADWGWIVVSMTHDVTRQDPLSGQTDTLLSDQDRTALRVDAHRDFGDWIARGNARVARYRDERLNYDEVRLNENLTWRPSYDWQLALDGSQAESRFLDSDRVTRHFDARLGGTWHSRRGWWADGYVTWRTQRDTAMLTETITEGFVRVRRNWPQLYVACSVGVGQRDRGSVQTTYQNLHVDITRTF